MRDIIILYRLSGKGRLACCKNLTGGGRNVRLHILSMKYSILEEAAVRARDPDFVKDYLLTFTTLPKVIFRQGKEFADHKGILTNFGDAMKLFEENLRLHLALTEKYRNESEARSKDVRTFS